MDPLTAISLASAIIQFIDFSSKLVGGAREIYASAAGATEENQSLDVVTSEMRQLASRLVPLKNDGQTEDERALSRLATECKIVSDQLEGLLGKLRSSEPKSKARSVWISLKSKLYEREKMELQKRLENCRSQLELQLSFLSR